MRRGGHTVVIVGLQSGGPQSTINTGFEVICLRMTESVVVVVGREKIVTWNLTTRNTSANINDSVRIATFNISLHRSLNIFISPDLSRIVVLKTPTLHQQSRRVNELKTYDVSTGRCLASAEGVPHSLSTLDGSEVTDILSEVAEGLDELWFTLDGREIWSLNDHYFPK